MPRAASELCLAAQVEHERHSLLPVPAVAARASPFHAACVVACGCLPLMLLLVGPVTRHRLTDGTKALTQPDALQESGQKFTGQPEASVLSFLASGLFLENAPVHNVRADRNITSDFTWFTEIKDTDGTVCYRHKYGEYLTVLENKKMVARSAAQGGAQFFLKTTNGDGTISLMARGGTYVTSLKSGTMVADGPFVQDWQKFRVERAPDGTVALRTSENKYVEIRWDVNELAYGMANISLQKENEDSAEEHRNVSVSGQQAFRIFVNATGEAITDSEKFTLMNDNLDRTVSLKTCYGTYLTAPGYPERFVTAENDHIAGREAFAMAYTPTGEVSLRAFDGHWCSVLAHGSITADAPKVGSWETFKRVDNDDGTLSLRSFHGKFISVIKVPMEPSAAPLQV